MSIELYFFSGTGNSLHIARELNSRFPDSKLIPIASLLNNHKNMLQNKEKRKEFLSKAKIVGFIFPCHGLTIPIPVKRFLKRLDLRHSHYIFGVVTRGGSIFRGFSAINRILKTQKKHLNASFMIKMGMNDPKLKTFEVPTKNELLEMEVNIKKKIELIYQTINHQEEYHDDDNGVTFSNSKLLNYVLERLVPFAVHFFSPRVNNYFYITSDCTGCGTCEKVCPSNKIKMINGTPVWQSNVDCYICYSCLNFCPSEAIQIHSKFYMKSYTEEKGRYPHPYAQIKDMINQKKPNIE